MDGSVLKQPLTSYGDIMGITIKEMENAEKSGRVTDSIKKIRWKSLITELLKKEKRFLTAGEIRESLKSNNHVYMQINYLKNSGILQMKAVDGKPHYGLAKW